VKLDERKSSSSQNVIIETIYLMIEMRLTPKIILDLTIGNIPGTTKVDTYTIFYKHLTRNVQIFVPANYPNNNFFDN
jgi:hypothetical protein